VLFSTFAVVLEFAAVFCDTEEEVSFVVSLEPHPTDKVTSINTANTVDIALIKDFLNIMFPLFFSNYFCTETYQI
jgi:hypothetical protein